MLTLIDNTSELLFRGGIFTEKQRLRIFSTQKRDEKNNAQEIRTKEARRRSNNTKNNNVKNKNMAIKHFDYNT